MAETGNAQAHGHATKGGPEKIIPTTKVNVAFPFSTIRVHEPSEHLAALAVVVAELAGVVTRMAPGPETEELRLRAKALSARLA